MHLDVENLTCRRGPVSILTHVTFSVAKGEALIVRGPNGSGKTTLLRTLAGLAPAPVGRVTPGPDEIAYAAHADGLKAQLDVAENLRFWAAVFGTRDITPALDAFALHGLTGRMAANLSAGQKRRLSLARLMLTGRPIWALDEPTISLDAKNVARFAAAVEAHCAAGGLAVIATHIELGLPAATTLDISAFAASPDEDRASDPFLDEALT